MSKNTWFIILAIAIVGIGAWYFTSSSTSPAQTAQTATTTDEQTGTDTTATNGSNSTIPVPETVGVGSIKDLLAMNKYLSCSINLVTATTKRSGTIYVAAGLMRADLFSTTGNKTKSVSMIDNGTSLYLWTNGASQGIQLPEPLGASGSNIALNGGIDPATAFSYVCHPWKADVDFFIAPQTITFSTSLKG